MRLFAFALFGCLAATFAGCSDKPSEQRTGNQTESKKDTSAASPTSAPKSNPVVFGYNCTSTAKMKTVRIPKPLPGGQNTFELVVQGKSFTLEAGKPFIFTSQFPDGVDAFTIRGINASERLDANNPNAFPIGLSFMKENVLGAEVRMDPITK